MAARQGTCAKCGAQFILLPVKGKPFLKCEGCRRPRQAPQAYCRDCGAPVGKWHRRCAPCLSLKEKADLLAAKTVPVAGMVEFDCAHCGARAAKYYRGSGTMPSLCGNKCKQAAYALRHGIYTQLQREQIADTFRVRVTTPMGAPRQGPVEPRRCVCGVYVTQKGYRLCSVCSGARAKAGKATARKAGKLRRRGARVESVDLLKVLERDGWRCQLCGRKTPARLRGSFDPRAPEVDHILPIAAGGEHSYRNTQCSCRACNIAKASTPRGQMRLF